MGVESNALMVRLRTPYKMFPGQAAMVHIHKEDCRLFWTLASNANVCTKIPPALISWYHQGSYFGRNPISKLHSTKYKKRILFGTDMYLRLVSSVASSVGYENPRSPNWKWPLCLIYLALFVSHPCASLWKQKRAFNFVSSHLGNCTSLGGSPSSNGSKNISKNVFQKNLLLSIFFNR